MKRLMMAVAGLVVAFAAMSVQARAQSPSFHVGGGVAMGMGDLSDVTETGWMAFAGVDMPIKSTTGLAIGATASWAHIPYEGDDDDATNIPALLVEAAYLIGAASPSPVKFYLRGGAGVLQHRYDAGNSGFDDESETKVGFGGGAGIMYARPGITPFAGVHVISGGSDTGYYTVYAGVSLGGGASNTASAIRRMIKR
jgi:hypothetical protein